MSDLRKSDFLTDWFLVDGCPFGLPEGTSEEWKQIIHAIKEKQNLLQFKRVGIRRWAAGIELYSPRNAISDEDCLIICDSELPVWLLNAETLLREANGEVEPGEAI